jgi:NitT/TauT family transport system substrate-binding protein
MAGRWSRLGRVFGAAIALSLGLAWTITGSHAQSLTPVKFKLDWVWQAPQSIWTLAYDRGYFIEEGLDVTIDRGYGGPDTLGSVASGAYDIGFSDINNLVEFNAKNPTHKVKSVFIVYDATLAAIITRKGNGINAPKDLEGKTIGAPLTTGGRTLFPAFAKANGIDESKVTWETIGIQLQDQQFAQGKFDAVASFATTSLLNLKELGVDLNKLTVFTFFKNGLDLYGSSLLVRPEWAEANPETVKKFLRVTMRGMKAMLEDKKAAIASLQKRDPVLNAGIETDRLDMMIDMALKTPGVEKNGVSFVDPERMDRGIAIVANAFNVTPAPKTADVYTDAYLPVPEQRKLKF